MRPFLWAIIILIFSVWIGEHIVEDPGYALFSYRHWTVEMPLWFFLVASILILVLYYFVIRFFDGIHSLFFHVKNCILSFPGARKLRQENAEKKRTLEKKMYRELIASEETPSIHAIHDVWHRMPRYLKKDSELIYCYANALSKYTETLPVVEKLIRRTLKKKWHKELIHLYGSLNMPKPEKQFAIAHTWLKHHSHNPILLMTLGKIAMRCRWWGKARDYFEKSLAKESSPEIYHEYGKLLEQLGEKNTALAYYKKGLEVAK